MVDYEYPLVRKVQDVYLHACREMAKVYQLKEKNGEVAQGLVLLVQARSDIVTILKQVEEATDVSAKDRAYYTHLINLHVMNLDTLTRETQYVFKHE